MVYEEYLTRKWLNGNLTNKEKSEFRKLPDYTLNVRIVEGAKRFNASFFQKQKNLILKNFTIIKFK